VSTVPTYPAGRDVYAERLGVTLPSCSPDCFKRIVTSSERDHLPDCPRGRATTETIEAKFRESQQPRPEADAQLPTPDEGAVISSAPAPIGLALVSQQDMFKMIAGGVAAGLRAPERVEFIVLLAGRSLEITMGAGDRAAVSVFATMFDLPRPTEQGWTMLKHGLGWGRIFGASSVDPNQVDRDDDEPTQPHLFGGWRVAVNCWVSAPRPIEQAAPAIAEVTA
jgi:hypothetical protein